MREETYEVFPDSAIDDDGELVHLALMGEAESATFQQAIKKEVWLEAMREELKAIKRNKTWEMTSLPNGKTAIKVK